MRRRSWDRPPRVEMMPLIDVVFLLLVVFLFSMMRMVRSYVVPVDLPRLGTGEVTDLAAVLVVSVEADGTVAAAGEPASLDALEERVRARHAAEPALAVLLHADREARHGVVAEVLDAVRAAGVERVLLVAREERAGDEHGSGGGAGSGGVRGSTGPQSSGGAEDRR